MMGDGGVILLFKRKPKRPLRPLHPLLEAYCDFWNPFFSWQQQMYDDHINAPTIFEPPEDCA